MVSQGGEVAGIELEYTAMKDGKLDAPARRSCIPADQVFNAIGQTFVGRANGSGAVDRDRGRPHQGR